MKASTEAYLGTCVRWWS